MRKQISRAPTVALLLLVFLAGCAGRTLRPDPPGRGPALALDPLTAEERTLAAEIARNAPEVRELLGTGRHVLASVETVALKRGLPQQEPANLGRHAQVLFYRYEGNLGVSALVDLTARRVTEVQEVDGDSVPVTGEELAEAREIALGDATLRRLLGAEAQSYRVEGLRVHAADTADPCWERRCVALLFRRADGAYLAETDVLVNLTGRTATVRQLPAERRDR